MWPFRNKPDAGFRFTEVSASGSVYILTTDYNQGSDELRALTQRINDALTAANCQDVPVVILPRGATIESLSNKQLLSILQKRLIHDTH